MMADEEDSLLLPLIGVFGAMIFFGCFAVPMKLVGKGVEMHPLVFQTYVAIAVCLSSLPLIAWNQFSWDDFSYWGFLSAMMWTVGNMMCVLTVDLLGVSVGQGLWSGAVALVGFVDGLLLGGSFDQWFPVILGLVMLLGGIVGLALVGGSSSESSEEDEEGEEKKVSLASSMASAPGKKDAGKIEGNKMDGRIQGYFYAGSIGVLAGSMYVPMNAKTDLKGIQQLVYALPFGIGSLVSVIILLLIHTVLHKGFGLLQPLGDWQVRKGMPPALVSGLLWNGGNMCSILSQLPPLGPGVGYPLTQCCILIGGLWGIIYFKEITGTKTIALFFACTTVLLVGASLLGIYGSS